MDYALLLDTFFDVCIRYQPMKKPTEYWENYRNLVEDKSEEEGISIQNRRS
jgi:hypothetical protein